MVRFLDNSQRLECRGQYLGDIVFDVLRSSVSEFCTNTGGLRLSVEEIFINMYIAIDKVRNEHASNFFSARVLLDELLSDLRNESVEIPDKQRECSEQDLNNAVVIIGTCVYACLLTHYEFGGFAEKLGEELKKRDSSLYEEILHRLEDVLFNNDPKSEFTVKMREYLCSEDYISDDFVQEYNKSERRQRYMTSAAISNAISRRLEELANKNEEGYVILDEPERKELLERLKKFISKMTADENEKITICLNTTKILNWFKGLKREVDKTKQIKREKWAEFIKNNIFGFDSWQISSIVGKL